MAASMQAAAVGVSSRTSLQLRSSNVSKAFGLEPVASSRLTCSLASKIAGFALATSPLVVSGAGAEGAGKRLTFDEIQSKTCMEVKGTGTANQCPTIDGGSEGFAFKPVEPVPGNEDSSTVMSSSTDSGMPQFPNKNSNRQVAVVSTLAAIALFLSGRLDLGVSLKDLSVDALPYEEALSNGKPTVVEFYADWCEVCKELAPDVYKVEQLYKGRVNFVMLNVDNTKWEQELDEFGVEGIPHFAFLDKEGNEEGNVTGRLPEKYLRENVDALSRGEASIPHARVVGQYSSAENRKVHQVVDPRSHG